VAKAVFKVGSEHVIHARHSDFYVFEKREDSQQRRLYIDYPSTFIVLEMLDIEQRAIFHALLGGKIVMISAGSLSLRKRVITPIRPFTPKPGRSIWKYS